MVFIHWCYYYHCEKPVCIRYTVIQFARENVGLCPFRGSYAREFELSHSSSIDRIIKITHAHNLHMKVLDFVPFTIRAQNYTDCFLENLLKRFYVITSALQYLQLNYASWNVKVDSLTFISFPEKYQTGEIHISTHIMLFHSII